MRHPPPFDEFAKMFFIEAFDGITPGKRHLSFVPLCNRISSVSRLNVNELLHDRKTWNRSDRLFVRRVRTEGGCNAFVCYKPGSRRIFSPFFSANWANAFSHSESGYTSDIMGFVLTISCDIN